MAGAGGFRHRVAFQQRERTDDNAGNLQGEFVDRFTIEAMIEARLGGEQIIAARLVGKQPITVTVRQCSATRGVELDWRVRDVRSGASYDISSIADPDDRGRYFQILCQPNV